MQSKYKKWAVAVAWRLDFQSAFLSFQGFATVAVATVACVVTFGRMFAITHEFGF
jgi:hypothetical protein